MPPEQPNPIAGVLDRNIHAIINSRKEEERHLSWKDRTAQRITSLFGSMSFVLLHVIVFGAWGFMNSGLIPRLRFDPNFSILDVLISMEAIFLSIFVLINQNRMVRTNARQADLTLQISLLAEHEVTQLIHLVRGIAEKMHLEHAANPELSELQQEIRPERILEELEARQRKADEDEGRQSG
jgi:uncharacterized membrane protein